MNIFSIPWPCLVIAIAILFVEQHCFETDAEDGDGEMSILTLMFLYKKLEKLIPLAF